MKPQYVVDAEEMHMYDKYTIEHIGIPAMVLMERAALSVVASMEQNIAFLKDKKILTVCGGGNNGGDGLAVSRLLIDKGCNVDIVLLSSETKCTEQTGRQLAILKHYCDTQQDNKLYIDKKNILPILNTKEYDIIIDGIFGVGLSRNIEGEYYKCINAINEYGAYVIAIDVPSGINSNNGRVMGCAIRANLTVTFAFAKRGLYLYPGKEYAGKIDCRDIGITIASFNGNTPKCFTFGCVNDFDNKEILQELHNILPPRLPYSNKGTFGKLLVIAGSKDMCGACILCGKSAYSVSTGMVKIVTVEENRNIIQTSFPEAMLLTYNSEAVPVKELSEAIKWADGVVIGPGMGQTQACISILELVLNEAESVVVLDADALNVLASFEELKCLAKGRKTKFPNSEMVLTPHQGELSRLMGIGIPELKDNPVKYARDLASTYNCIVVNKDAVTIVCDEGDRFYLNITGNSGMATAGSGDVLAGILGGLLVQKRDRCNTMSEYVAQGVYLHGCAGDLAKKRVGEHGMVAGDLVESLIEISKEG